MSETAERCARELDVVVARLARHFARAEPRRRAHAYLRGLLSPVERKNGWQLAEYAGDRRPYGVQHLLSRADWDADAVRDELRAYVWERLGDRNGVLTVAETGFPKKGTKSAGVQRQSCGTARRVENCQVGVFLAVAGRKGRAFLDRELYLPEEWAEDERRRREAGVPAAVTYATKPQLARRMLRRALGGGVRAAWVTADEVDDSDSELRRWLEERDQPYVLAVTRRQHVAVGLRQRTVRSLAEGVPAGVWQRLSAGDGPGGPRLNEWAMIPVSSPEPKRFVRRLLVRRDIDDPTDLAYYLCGGPPETPLTGLVRVVGSRWGVEESFEVAKQEVGLDHYEVRSWVGWYRHVTLALFAHALLTVTRSTSGVPRDLR